MFMEKLNPPKPLSKDLNLIEEEDGSIKVDELTIPAAPLPTLSTDAPESRLIITHLVAKNFKSYYGDQIIGPFNKNFSAVVGPNGSGKSNVIDAMMFVFGHKASRIRAKKLSALIHKSSNNTNCTSCTVIVNFAVIRDRDGGRIVDGSKFSISRTAHTDGSSFYEVMGKRSNQRDVVKLLKKYGIDMDYTRFLIMQGEIESIALMGPIGKSEQDSGMLEYIEDIVGSNRLIEPINYLNTKVREYTEVVNHKLEDLRAVEIELKSLEKPKNDAVEYLKKENQMILTQNSLYQFQKLSKEDELEQIVEEKAKFLEEVKTLKAEINELQSSKKNVENEMSGLNRKYSDTHKEVDQHKKEFELIDRQDVANITDINHKKQQVLAHKETLKQAQKELEKLTKQTAVFEKETAELLEKKAKLEDEKEIDEKKTHEAMSSMKEETVLLQEKKDKLEGKLVGLRDNLNNARSEMELAKSELNLIKSSGKKEKDKLTTMTSSLERNETELSHELKAIDEEESKLISLEGEVKELQTQLENSKEQESSLMTQLRAGRSRLEEARQSHQNTSSSSLVKGLLKEKAKGTLPGLYGRLGDLGAIDEKYDVAISTACGRLDNIVTDTMKTAKACVEFLKKTNLGYATFISLEEMRRYEHAANQRISTPENVPRLFDLIRVNDRSLLTAFYFALGNTLVADDLEQATRIGLHGRERHRVVTLRGDVIDLAGTMSGGGNRVSRGRMGQTVLNASPYSDADIARMTSELDTINRQYGACKKTSESLQEQISHKSREIPMLQSSIRKRKLRVKSCQAMVESLRSQIGEQEKRASEVKVDEKEIAKLEKKIQEKTKIYNVAAEETSDFEEKIAELQSEILKISKGKLGKAQKALDNMKKKVAEVSQAVNKSSVNAKQSKAKITKLEKKIIHIEGEIEDCKKSIQELHAKNEEHTKKGIEIMEMIKTKQSIMDEVKEKVSDLKKSIAEFTEKEHGLKSKEIEAKNKLKSHEQQEAEQIAIIKSLKSKLAKLKLNVVEDDPTEIPVLSREDLSSLNAKSLSSEIELLKMQLEEKKPDISAIESYKKTQQTLAAKETEVAKVTGLRDLQAKRYEALKVRRTEEFEYAFQIIKRKLKEIYQMLTLGGDAELEYADSQDIFGKGIEFSVRPPGKSWKSMKNLSGGEKTLSSLALVFSLHYYRPTPFYVMDEIDAALDERNVAIVGIFLKEQQKNAQFIIVSLRNVMNEMADHLLGIYKTDNCTKNISLTDVTKWIEEPGWINFVDEARVA